MNRYEKGKIYKIVSPDFKMCYIGSTCETLCRRLERHRMAYRKYLKGQRMETKCHLIFDEYGVENCLIFLLEDCPCANKEQLRAKEGEYQQTIDCINKNVAGRTYQQYYKDKKETIKERTREDYHNNIDQRKATQKEYRQRKKDILKEKKKQHREANFEEYQRRQKEAYQKKRETILEKMKETYTCGCGATTTKCHKMRHEKSKKHQGWLKQQEQE